jgi:hypothetical protein
MAALRISCSVSAIQKDKVLLVVLKQLVGASALIESSPNSFIDFFHFDKVIFLTKKGIIVPVDTK